MPHCKAGIYLTPRQCPSWIPACAGMTEEARIKIIKAVDVRLSLCRHSSESSPAWTQGESGACLPQAGWEQAAEESRKGADGRLSGWRPTLVFSSLSFRRRPESSGFIIHSRVSGNDNLMPHSKAGIYLTPRQCPSWIPAFAGMTEEARIKIIKAVDVRLSLCRHSSESSPVWTQG